MCAIVDANVSHEVFGSNPPQAGERFFIWLNAGTGRLVAGGKLLDELNRSSADFRRWAQQVRRAGKMRIVDREKVDSRTKDIENEGKCKSDDPHVIALAQVSGARLLYSNDGDLQKDFNNTDLVNNPPGHVYSTLKTKNFTRARRNTLRRRDLCGEGR